LLKIEKKSCSPLIFNFVFGPNGFGSPFFSPLIFPRRPSCSRLLGPTSQPSPARLPSPSSSSRQATEAVARDRPKRRHPSHLRPPARLLRPSTPPDMALPPHPLPSPSISPSPISSPTRNITINSRRPSSHPDRLCSLARPYIKASLTSSLITAPCAALCSTPSYLLVPLLRALCAATI
jgi:hypothetical protein